MPSLNALREFKASFNNIGREKANLKAKNLPFDDLELPDSEPDPTALNQAQKGDEQGSLAEDEDQRAAEYDALAQDTLAQDFLAQDPGISNTQTDADTAQADASPLDTFDFSAFLGAQPQDLPDPPSAADIGGSDSADAVASDAGTTAPDVAYYPPEELLSNLSEELDAAPPDEDIPPSEEEKPGTADDLPAEPTPVDGAETPELPAEPVPADGGDNLNPDDLGDLDIPAAQTPAEGDDNLNPDDLGNLDSPAEQTPATDDDNFSLDDLGDLASPAAQTPAADDDNLNLDDLGNLSSPAEQTPAADDDSLNLDDLGDLAGSAAQTPATDDSLNLDDVGDLASPAAQTPATDDDNFSLDDLGDLASPAAQTPAADDDNLNLDDLGDLASPAAQTPAADDDNLSLDDLGDLASPAAQTPAVDDDNLNLDDVGDLASPATQTPAADDDNLNLDDLGDLGSEPAPEAGAPPADAAPASGDETVDIDNLGDIATPNAQASAGDDENINFDALDNFDPGNDTASTDSGENFDFSGLDNFDIPEEPAPAPPADSTPEAGDLGDLDIPAPSDEPAPADNADNLDNLDGFDIPEEPAPAPPAESTPEAGDLGDLDIPAPSDEPAPADNADDLNVDDLGDLDIPAAQTPAADDDNLGDLGDLDIPAAQPAAADDDNFSLDDLGDFDLGSEPTPEDSAETTDTEPVPADGENLDSSNDLDLDSLEGFDLPDDQTADNGAGDLDLDNLGGFDLGDDSGAEGDSAGEDFSLPDLNDVLPGAQRKIIPDVNAKPKARAKRLGKDKKIVPAFTPAENVDEIQLNEEDLESLQRTLSNYPLNLRIACEEIIAEHVVEPEKLSKLISYLVQGETAKETALLAGHILGKMITIPKGFEKSSGEALEAERASFAYIFVHNFLPILRILAFVLAILGSASYLIYEFIYLPNKAEALYKMGYERIYAGEYQRANERFSEAFYETYRKKNWFYKYAEAFRDERQYIYAEQKYDELLRNYPRDKKGVLDYAHLETYYLRNYAKADNLLRRQLLDYAPNDYDGLLAVGDNSLMWAEIDPSKYEDARYSYARLLDKYGWTVPVAERMLRYFIRIDDLKEVLFVKQWFDESAKRNLSAESLADLGGYLLDKQLEETKGVPNAYIEYISGVRDLLLQAVQLDPALPEPHYHLARYYHNLGGVAEERTTLEHAIYAFDHAREESVRRLNYRIDTHQRYADLLINNREFMPAEEQLIKGINLYEDALSRRLMSRSPQYGKLYAGLGDLEYFTKVGNMESALRFYHRSEQNGWAPPEMQYRMGSAYYQLENWKNALEYFFNASSSLPLNRRILFAMGNAALKRGDYFAAHAYYNRLLDILENQRVRLPILLPNDRPEYLELAERLMMARNNAGVACEMLASQTGDRSYQTRALAFYAEAERAWDARSRDPSTLIRSGSTPLPYLNSRNALYPVESYEPQIFIRIDREASESSPWEKLTPLAWVESTRD